MPRLTDPFNTPIEDDGAIETRSQMVNWLDQPDQDNANDSLDYLCMITGKKNGQRIVDDLVNGKSVVFKAKDILRAALLSPLPPEDAHVKAVLQLIANGTALQPVYLIRGRVKAGIPLVIVDGYHRVSAAWYTDPGTAVVAFIAQA